MGAFKGWKKISSAKDHSVLRNSDGHELKIAHAGLSPKMRGHLAEIPVHSENTNPAGKVSTAKNKGTIKMANGGQAWSQGDKEAFSRGASGAKAPTKIESDSVHKVSNSAPTVSHQEESDDEKSIANTQKANLVDPSKADALAKTNAARAAYKAPFADGGPVTDEMVPGVSMDASNPQAYDFEQKKAAIAQSMQGERPNPEALDTAVTSKALDQIDSEKAAGAQAAATVGADQGAAYQQAIDLNRRLEAQGLPTRPLPPMPAVGVPGSPSPQQGEGLMAPTAISQGQDQGSSDPYGTQATQDAYMRGIGEQKAGLMGEAQALGQQGAAEAQVAHDAAVNKKTLMDNYQNEMGKLNEQRSQIQAEIQKAQIDPNHYMGSMSTGERISSAIGLILGGMGSGLTGGENPAMKMLQMNIDRDIAAQQANLGTKKSLLEFNQQMYGNLKEAKEMTRIMMNDQVSMQLKEAAAKSMEPLAKERARQAWGQLDQTSAAMIGQNAMRKTMLQGMKDGKVAPASVIEFALPKEDRPAARKELTEAQEAVKARDNLLGAFDKVDKLQTVGNRITSPWQSKAQIEALQGPLVAQMSKATAGRFTEQDAGMLTPLWPTLKDDPASRLVKRAAMQRIINEKMNYPTLDAYHINPAKTTGRFNDQGNSKYSEIPYVPNKKR